MNRPKEEQANWQRQVLNALPDVAKRNITKSRAAIAVAAIAACTTAAACKCSANEADGVPEHMSEIYNELKSNYGEESARFAINTIQNGAAIKDHPEKEKGLAESKKRLKKLYPKVEPLRLFGYMDEPREAEQVAILHSARKDILDSKTKYKHYLPLSFIVAVLSNEGRSLDLDHPKHKDKNGFQNYGNDTFGSEFAKVADAGFIPEDFEDEFEVSEKRNKFGTIVKSAQFKTREAALRAAVAMIAYHQHLFYEDLVRKGISPAELSGDERLFFTYYYYNSGPNSQADKKIKSEKDLHDFFRASSFRKAKGNAFRVMTGTKWLQMNGVFNQDPEKDFWWSEEEEEKQSESDSSKKNNPKKNSKAAPKEAEKDEKSSVPQVEACDKDPDKLHTDLEVPYYLENKGRLTYEWKCLFEAARKRGWKGKLKGRISGLRTYKEQKYFWDLYQSGDGAPAFNPDGPNAHKAMHMFENVKREGNWTQSVDVYQAAKLIKIARKMGVDLYRPHKGEPWHVQARKEFEVAGD